MCDAAPLASFFALLVDCGVTLYRSTTELKAANLALMLECLPLFHFHLGITLVHQGCKLLKLYPLRDRDRASLLL